MGYKGIIDSLKSDGAIFRCQGIADAVKEHANTPAVIKAMTALKNDDVIILGRRVGAYARAALDVIGVEEYKGNDPDIIELITYFAEEAMTA